MAQDLEFKFKWVDEGGNAQGFLSKKGSLIREELTLDDEVIPVVVILRAVSRFKRIIGRLVAAHRWHQACSMTYRRQPIARYS